jgi:hypothetical protein
MKLEIMPVFSISIAAVVGLEGGLPPSLSPEIYHLMLVKLEI